MQPLWHARSGGRMKEKSSGSCAVLSARIHLNLNGKEPGHRPFRHLNACLREKSQALAASDITG